MNKLNVKLPLFIRYWWVIELIVFILVGYVIGYGWAFLIIILSCVLGLLMIGGQARRIAKMMKSEPMSGAFMAMNVINSSFIFVSGLFFLIPGFLTDILALICLIPAIRIAMVNKMMAHSMKGFTQGFTTQSTAANDHSQAKSHHTIEGEFWKEDAKDEKNDKNQ